jgi:Zn-dependent protease/predicted transcriptional regulator
LRSLTIARIRGIAIEVHPSWLLILGLVSWTLADEAFPSLYEDWSTAAYWTVGVIAALLLFVTVLLHELAHAVVAQRRGLPVPKITLFIFGGVSHLGGQPKSAGEEFAIAIAGPATSFGIALITGIASALVPGEKVAAILGYLATVNLLLGVFNLLPGFPLDGGRVLRSIVWRRTSSLARATRTAGRVGELFAYLMMAFGFSMFIAGYPINGLWALLIAWFLLSAARAEMASVQLDQVLGRLKAGDVMDSAFPAVGPGTTAQQIVDEYFLGKGERAVMVSEEGVVLGILTITDVSRKDRAAWPQMKAAELMTPREAVITVARDSSALDVLALLGEKRLNQVPVLDGGRMVGLIARRELLDRIQLTESLERGKPAAV